MFFLIGLGLGDPTDVGVFGQQIIKKCERVYLEAYTSILVNGTEPSLETYYGRKILIADREQVEVGAGDLLQSADVQDVALLVVGDPLSATTHSDLMLRAQALGIPVQVLSNASVLTSAATTGLKLERLGEVVSIPYWEENWQPESFYDKICTNLKHGLHTLCLLDIKVKEQTVENIIKNRKLFEPPRFMRTHEAAKQLLAIIEKREQQDNSCTEGTLRRDTTCIACVRLGTERQKNLVMTLQESAEADLGEPLHSMVVCAPLSDAETRDAAALASWYQGATKPASSCAGRLHLIGMGLTISDITVKGVEILLKTNHVFLDKASRQILNVLLGSRSIREIFSDVFNPDELDRLDAAFDVNKPSVSASDCEDVLALLKSGEDVTIMIWGDPLALTEYTSLLTRLVDCNIPFSVVHNASLINSVASCGLQLYSFGEVIRLPESGSIYDPHSLPDVPVFYKKLMSNISVGWHSLCILHREGNDKLSQWTPCEVARLLLKLSSVIESSKIDGACRVVIGKMPTRGQPIYYNTNLQDLANADIFRSETALYALIVLGHTHPLEEECLAALTKPISIS